MYSGKYAPFSSTGKQVKKIRKGRGKKNHKLNAKVEITAKRVHEKKIRIILEKWKKIFSRRAGNGF